MIIRKASDQVKLMFAAAGGIVALDTVLRVFVANNYFTEEVNLLLFRFVATLEPVYLSRLADSGQYRLIPILLAVLLLALATAFLRGDGILRLSSHYFGRPFIIISASLTVFAFYLLFPDYSPVYFSMHLYGATDKDTWISLPLIFLLYGPVLAGLGKLASLTRATPVPVSLEDPARVDIDLSKIKKGTDNVRADVFLGADFYSSASRIVEAVVSRKIGLKNVGKTQISIPNEITGEFIDSYVSVMSYAIQLAKDNNNLNEAMLARFSIAKYLLECANNECEKALVQLRNDSDTKKTRGGHSVKKLDAHRYLVWASIHKTEIVMSVLKIINSEMQSADIRKISPLCESLTGKKEVVDGDIVCNPMMASPYPFEERNLGPWYFLFGHRKDDHYSFVFLARVLAMLVSSRTGKQMAGEIVPERGISSATVLEPYWSDSEDNINRLFDGYDSKSMSDHSQSKQGPQKLRKQSFQKELLRTYGYFLLDAGVLRTVVASYFVYDLPAAYSQAVSRQFLQQHLSGKIPVRTILNELPSSFGADARTQMEVLLNELKSKVDKALANEPDEYVLRLIKDIGRFRRDLRYYQVCRDLFQQINLVVDSDKLRLSRANRVLYDFSKPAAVSSKEDSGHVVVKADIRGSTALTKIMLEKGLNPATYFSDYFFKPIDALLDTYDATKIFVEGDAIILAIAGVDGISAARACGLASSISEMIENLNASARHHGLPVLEMGIGIAYRKATPTFLFDGDRPVVISNAISDADRLSSCSWQLKEKASELNIRPYRVAVFEATKDNAELAYKGQHFINYNVNGIHINEGIFKLLSKEIALEKKEIRLSGMNKKGEFYVGKYIVTNGAARRVVVRRGVIRPLGASASENTRPEKYYYEVIADKDLLSLLQASPS